MKKYNWRYYKCKDSRGRYVHVIQNLNYTSLHIEGKSKNNVFEKFNFFLKKQVTGDVKEI